MLKVGVIAEISKIELLVSSRTERVKGRKYLPMLLETSFEKDGLNQMMFLLQFLDDLLLFSFLLIGHLN